jgi:2-polyprenyl-3-methyl-5-hydroxy-6-metoxy-1,4-benzoquinol methylase
MGDVGGRRICDLACGQGRVARHLANQGANVVGVDLSTKLLEIARRYDESDPRGITYVHADVRNLDEHALGQVDGVVCYMALMDIADLGPTLASVARILRPGGWFVFSILHPCFHTSQSGEMDTPEGPARTIRQYFAEGYWRSDTRPGPPGRIGAYHRTLSTYINAISDAGLQLERMCEPLGVSDVADSPSLSGVTRPVWREVPAVLVVRCRRSE